ncbi:MAG: hypothetical protein ACYC96_16735 [Fimbriimonadaceae bacterium]
MDTKRIIPWALASAQVLFAAGEHAAQRTVTRAPFPGQAPPPQPTKWQYKLEPAAFNFPGSPAAAFYSNPAVWNGDGMQGWEFAGVVPVKSYTTASGQTMTGGHYPGGQMTSYFTMLVFKKPM